MFRYLCVLHSFLLVLQRDMLSGGATLTAIEAAVRESTHTTLWRLRAW